MAIAEADRLAGLLADGPTLPGVALAPPVFITGPKMKAAWRVWVDVIPLLAERGLIEALDKHALAMLCVYIGEFVAANEEVLRNGFTTRVKTVSGDYMLRENPAVSIRDTAQKVVMDISKRFGLTPLDRAYLSKMQKGADIDPSLFDHLAPQPAETEEAADPAIAEWGALLEQPSKPLN